MRRGICFYLECGGSTPLSSQGICHPEAKPPLAVDEPPLMPCHPEPLRGEACLPQAGICFFLARKF